MKDHMESQSNRNGQRFNPGKGQRGFTLVGALIGLAIFVIGILASFSMQTMALNSTGKSQKYTQGNSWAQDTMETLLGLPYDDALLEPVKGDDGLNVGGLMHTLVRDAYTIKWVVYTSDNNGENINSFVNIRDDSLFDELEKNQNLVDIPDNLKVVSLQVSHPMGTNNHLVFVKPDG